MKMIVMVVQAEDAGGLLAQLTESGYRTTRIKTAGGFLRDTNATIFLGIEDQQVDDVLRIVRENCTTRRQHINPVPPVMEPGEFFLPYPVEVEVGGATVFVLDVARFERI
ncbi:MAG: cyclic-di-AMP receptor [Chloroflexi bacterium]|nr:cyclic-di-AMP receptor [Chloroflexota bacterium]